MLAASVLDGIRPSTRRPRVVIDGRFIQAHFPGVGRFCYSLIDALKRLGEGLHFVVHSGPEVRMKRLREHSSALTLIAFLLVQAALLAWTTRGTYGVDYAAYHLAGRALQQGRNIYTLTAADWDELAAEAKVKEVAPPFRYPPLVAGVLRLTVSLPFTTALLVWRVLTIAALLITALSLSWFLRKRWIDPLVFAAASFFVPAITTLFAGQANTFVLAALALYLLLDQRGHYWRAGVALAFAILIKPLPIALAALLIWRREWRRLSALLSGLAIGAVITVALSGASANLDYLRSFFDVAPSNVVAYPPNQSVSGFWLRLLTRNEYSIALIDRPAWASALSFSTIGVLSAIAAYLTWPRRRETFSAALGLVLVTSGLIVPVSWYHHHTIDLIPLLLAWFATSQRSLRAALLIAYALIGMQGLLWKAFAGNTLLLSLATYGLLIIYVVTAKRLRRTSAAVAPASQ